MIQLPLPISDEEFEVVLLSHVLEHVQAPLVMLRECNRILAPGGKLVVGLPIEDGLYARLRMDYFGGGEGHLYSFSLRNLDKLLGLTGFAKERVVCHLPRLGNRLSQWNARLTQLLGTRLYTLSAAYWCVARKVATPTPDQKLSDYFGR
jgi:ubiquinone/menaquinone biosynthesis C-methylase UbiE